ncbi:hypothetical protein FSC37_18650 [Piscinibacter aquaticus]|uniref:Uncharacterized protein n=1 Tax=Piscinibacter aquaticus TaxID=392597 RepID=A0A5C6U223_9BURK|nr:hypothetical protein FSC37_18650 [Piscinibacter aquaticus]
MKGFPELNVTSNLTGLASDLPAPLRKAAESPLPLRYQTALAGEPVAGQAPRDTLRIDLGPLLQVQYERELAEAGPRVLRGGIGINEPAPTPSSGVWVHASPGVLAARCLGRRRLTALSGCHRQPCVRQRQRSGG